MRAGNRNVRRRRGFTLVELLVVIAIISILVSLTAVTVFQLIGNQQGNNTKSELSRLETELQKEYRAAADKFQKEPIPPPNPSDPNNIGNVYYTVIAPPPPAVGMATVNGQVDQNVARVIWVKFRLKQTFPNNFYEALNPTPMPPLGLYQNQLSLLGYTAANTVSPQQWESSACLVMALGRAEDGAGVKPETLGLNSFIHSFPTPSGGTIPALVDGWGQPLAFCRWPCYSPVLNPNSQPLSGDKNDPVDPSGLLVSTTWQSTGGYATFQTYCHPVPAHAAGTEAMTYRLFPLIASEGPDKVLGLDKEPLALPLAKPPTLGPAPVTYYFGPLPANQNLPAPNPTYSFDDLYPTLAPAQ